MEGAPHNADFIAKLRGEGKSDAEILTVASAENAASQAAMIAAQIAEIGKAPVPQQIEIYNAQISAMGSMMPPGMPSPEAMQFSVDGEIKALEIAATGDKAAFVAFFGDFAKQMGAFGMGGEAPSQEEMDGIFEENVSKAKVPDAVLLAKLAGAQQASMMGMQAAMVTAMKGELAKLQA